MLLTQASANAKSKHSRRRTAYLVAANERYAFGVCQLLNTRLVDMAMPNVLGEICFGGLASKALYLQ